MDQDTMPALYVRRSIAPPKHCDPPHFPGNFRDLYAQKLHAAQAAVALKSDTRRHAASVTPNAAIRDLSPLLNEAGLIYECNLVEWKDEVVEYKRFNPKDSTTYTETWFRTVVVIEFLLTDIETGHQESRRMAGASFNKDGDGIVHAQSQALKQFLLKTLQVIPDKVGDPGRPRRTRMPQPTGGQPGSRGFAKVDGSWVDEATGEEVPSCEHCRGPVLKGQCIKEACEAHDPPELKKNRPEPAPSEPAPTKPSENGELKIRELKAEYSRLAGKVETWQEDALCEGADNVPADFEEWKAEHYQAVIGAFREKGAPVVFSLMAQRMAKKEPAPAQDIERVRDLAADLGALNSQRVEVALQSGWMGALRWAEMLIELETPTTTEAS